MKQRHIPEDSKLQLLNRVTQTSESPKSAQYVKKQGMKKKIKKIVLRWKYTETT
jgi:hypothetical protein